ncbi:hypothetical protein ACN28I_20645 [Archangium gephyra]|uniref:hypothetical protein n=1 Tax=Archangium gephyra TaxID=48 RepID=UPI003B7BEC77
MLLHATNRSDMTLSQGTRAVWVEWTCAPVASTESRQRVGINRPDLQFDYNGRRYQVEYDTPTSGRGTGHQLRIKSNDPDAETILLIVP